MIIKSLIAATLLSAGVASTALAGEANYEPFPMSISIGTGGSAAGHVYVNNLPETYGLPGNFYNGTQRYAQAESLNRWEVRQDQHRLAQAQGQLRPNG